MKDKAELLSKIVEHFEYLIDWAFVWYETSEHRDGIWKEQCRLCGQSRMVDTDEKLIHHEYCPIGTAQELVKPTEEWRKEIVDMLWQAEKAGE